MIARFLLSHGRRQASALSRNASRPIALEKNITVRLAWDKGMDEFRRDKVHKTPIIANIMITGPRGTMHFPLHQGLLVGITPARDDNEQQLFIYRDEQFVAESTKYQRGFVRAMQGTTAAHIRQFIEGVTEGHLVSLRLVGVGFKAALDRSSIVLRVGLSHSVSVPLPAGVQCQVPIPTKILLSGNDLRQLTMIAAAIRRIRPPEPYSGKGIYVGDETIQRKEGKRSK